MDESGSVVGVVTSKLNDLDIAATIGSIPQNVNFAIKAQVARAFLTDQGIAYIVEASTVKHETPAIATEALAFMMPVECWK